ncbi:MAG TPA: hypothetical protein VHC41_11735 [Mycobacteriales bacterium]|jgi:hypothetical protein|nr:hypothetical protein [Mycobacteriales bacterium]
MIKQVYFAKRNPSTTHAQFLQNWKQHAALAGRFPSIVGRFTGVVQCRRTDEAASLDVDQDHDGVNILTCKDLLAASTVDDDPNIDTMLTDELRVFSRYVRESTITAVEDVLVRGPVGTLVLLELVTRRPGVTLPAFVSAWTGDYASRLMQSERFGDRVSRFVHNAVIFPTPPDYPYDGLAELWIDSAASAAELIQQSDAAHAATGDGAFDISRRLLLQVNHAWEARPA